MKYFFSLIILAVAFTACKTTVENQYQLQVGDILFQDLDCGDACDAIESVTEGVNGWDFSHCGIVVKKDGELQVIEAYGAVQAVSIDTFMNRYVDSNGKPKVVIGRPKNKDIAQKSASLASSYLGKDYDKAFQLNDDSYYCSELVYECYKKGNNGQEYFPLNLMTFKDPATDSMMPFWVKYYDELNQPIPEGEKGINPGAISRSDKLDIIYLN